MGERVVDELTGEPIASETSSDTLHCDPTSDVIPHIVDSFRASTLTNLQGNTGPDRLQYMIMVSNQVIRETRRRRIERSYIAEQREQYNLVSWLV